MKLLLRGDSRLFARMPQAARFCMKSDCIVRRNTITIQKGQSGMPMKERKDTPMSFRASARFKTALALAATHENRSQANLLETLVYDFCRQKGIEIPSDQAVKDDQADN